MGDMENRTRREAEDYQVSIFIDLPDDNMVFSRIKSELFKTKLKT